MIASSIDQGKAAADAFQASQDRYRLNVGMNALAKTYGPVAYVPQQAQEAENYLHSTQMNPLYVQQQAAQNTGMDLTNQYNSAANGPRIEQLGIQNAAGQLANTQTAAVNDQAAAQQQAALARQQLSAMLGTVGTAAQQPGANPAAIWDQAAPQVSQMLGVNPAQLGGYRDSFIKDPMGFITQTQQMLGATEQARMTPEQRSAASNAASLDASRMAMSGMYSGKTDALVTTTADSSALTAAQIAEKQANTDRLRAIASGQAGAGSAAPKISTVKPTTLEGNQEQYAAIQASRLKLSNLMGPGGVLAETMKAAEGLSSYPMVSAAQIAAGTGPASVVAANKKQIDAALSLIDAQNLQATGTKLTIRNLAEFKALADAYGNYDPSTMPPSQVQSTLARMKELLPTLLAPWDAQLDASRKTIHGMGGFAPDEPGYGTEAAAPVAFDISRAADAIRSIESGSAQGNYSAVNKDTGAIGAYQVMPDNVGPWTEAYYGKKLTPDEFKASPDAQNAVFEGRFGSYVKQFGPEGAAQAWLGGPGSVGKANGPADANGTTTNAYGERFTSLYGGSDAPYQNAAQAAPSPAANFAATDAAAQASQMQAPAPTVAQAPNRMDAFQQQQQAQGFQTPQLTPQQIGSPAFTIPGTNFTVGQAILWLRDQQKKGMDEQTAAAIAQKLGIARQ